MNKKNFIVEQINYKKAYPIFEKEIAHNFDLIKKKGTHCLIVGEGEIGAKAHNLITYAEEILDAGLHIKPFVVLTSECFERMKFLSGLSGSFLARTPYNQRKIDKIDGQLQVFLRQIQKYFQKEKVLFVRSSAVGDSAGTGVRQSYRGKNTTNVLEQNIKKVIESDMTEDVELFRKDAHIKDGLGTIITGLVGNQYNNIFAPPISGYAFTNQYQSGTHINIGPGIGGGISSMNKLCISNKDITKNQTLGDYIRDVFCNHEDLHSSMFNLELKVFNGDKYFDVFIDGLNSHENLTNSKKLLIKDAEKETIYPLLEQLDKLKEIIGSDLYLEFALGKNPENNPSRYINQIDTTKTSQHNIEKIPLDNTVATLNSIINSGKKTLKKRVFVQYPGAMENLYEFNKSNTNYGLIISDRALSSDNPIDYSYFSNAQAIVMTVGRNCARQPIAHLGGRTKVSGKLFGAIVRSNPYIGYEMKRTPSINQMIKNDNWKKKITALPGEFSTIGVDEYSTLGIWDKEMTIECDESSDYGVIYTNINSFH